MLHSEKIVREDVDSIIAHLLAVGGIQQSGSCNALIRLGEIRDRLESHVGIEDQLLVIDISGDAAGWVGVNESGSKWLRDNI
jgi:hypothetical protein